MARILCMAEFIDKDPAKLSAASSHGGRSSSAHHSHARSAQSKDRRSTARNLHQSEPGSYASCVQPSPACPGGICPGVLWSVSALSCIQPSPVSADPSAAVADRSPVHCPVSPALEADVRDIRRLLKTYVTRLETKDAAARAAKEWRIVARVLDRLFFFCYIGTIIVSMFTIFPGDMSHLHSTEPPADSSTTATPDTDYDYTR